MVVNERRGFGVSVPDRIKDYWVLGYGFSIIGFWVYGVLGFGFRIMGSWVLG